MTEDGKYVTELFNEVNNITQQTNTKSDFHFVALVYYQNNT